jgi:hypothetical protein
LTDDAVDFDDDFRRRFGGRRLGANARRRDGRDQERDGSEKRKERIFKRHIKTLIVENKGERLRKSAFDDGRRKAFFEN